MLVLMAFQTSSKDPFTAYSEAITGSDEFLKMIPVKGGEFLMGSNSHDPDEAPVHKVTIDDFWMGAYEITWDQYELFLDRQTDAVENPEKNNEVSIEINAISSATTPYVDMSHGMGKKGFPVINITQYAALTFCKWLSAKTGNFYRLPTEAEWEYACRAGSTQDYSFGDNRANLDTYAWYSSNSGEKYQKVGTKEPNSFGLYDMHGNVAEWTMDQYAANSYMDQKSSVFNNPWVKPTQLYPRAVRGGSWMDTAEDLRSSARTASKAEWKRIDPQIPKSRWWFTNAPHLGFRIVRPLKTPSKDEIASYWLEAMDDY